MTWAEFKSTVLTFLPLDAPRAGTASLIESLIKSTCLDYIRLFPGYDNPTETRVLASAGLRVQNALLFELAAGTELIRAEIADTWSENQDVDGEASDSAYRDSWRGKLTVLPWADRFPVIYGEPHVAAFDPRTAKFYAPFFESPPQALVIHARYRPTNWVDGDEVPFGLQDAEMSAAYVQAHIARSIDKNPRLADEHDRRFKEMRRVRYIEQKDFPVAARMLPTLLSTAGSDYVVSLGSLTELRAVATAGGAVPAGAVFSVMTTGVLTQWRLVAGTNADDGDVYARPADYHASTNARVWQRVTADTAP